MRVSRKCGSHRSPQCSVSGWGEPLRRLPSPCQPSPHPVIRRGSISISQLSGLVNQAPRMAVFTGDQRKGRGDMEKGGSEPQGAGLGSTLSWICSSPEEESGHLTHFPCHWP